MRTALEKTLYGDNQSASGHSTETFCSNFLKNYRKMINDYERKLKGLDFLHFNKCLCRRKISKSYFFYLSARSDWPKMSHRVLFAQYCRVCAPGLQYISPYFSFFGVYFWSWYIYNFIEVELKINNR